MEGHPGSHPQRSPPARVVQPRYADRTQVDAGLKLSAAGTDMTNRVMDQVKSEPPHEVIELSSDDEDAHEPPQQVKSVPPREVIELSSDDEDVHEPPQKRRKAQRPVLRGKLSSHMQGEGALVSGFTSRAEHRVSGLLGARNRKKLSPLSRLGVINKEFGEVADELRKYERAVDEVRL